MRQDQPAQFTLIVDGVVTATFNQRGRAWNAADAAAKTASTVKLLEGSNVISEFEAYEPQETHMNAIEFDALHQYSDDSEIVSLVRFFADSVDEHGIVRAPGKFEGEPIHTVYFYGWMLQGDGDTTYEPCEHLDESDDNVQEPCDCELEEAYTTFHVTAGDEEAFPLTLAGQAGKDLRIRTDSVGFVYSWIVD